MTVRLIFLPGVGADHRAFSKLELTERYPCVFVDWIPLKGRDKTFEAYCKRMTLAYEITSGDTLIGMSFGGLIAQKVAHELGSQKVVLISSFRNRNDLRALMRLGLDLKLHRLLPPLRIPVLSDAIAFILNSSNRESRTVIADMLKSSDFQFISWAINQIDKTDLSDIYRSDFLSFTGDKDKLVSDWESENHLSIRDGQHFMVYDHGEKITNAIKHFLDP